MNDVVERVAKAVAEVLGETWRVTPQDGLNNRARFVARAAIIETLKSLREPTDEMVAAGSRSRPYREDDGEYDDITYRDNTVGTWESMIDAALADASPDIGKEGIGNDVR